MNDLTAGLLMPTDASEKRFGIRFLSLVRQASPGLFPKKCGNEEPLIHSCRAWNEQQIVDHCWNDPFLWSAMRTGVCGLFSLGKAQLHCGLFIYGKPRSDVAEEIKKLFALLSEEFPVDFGWIHVLTDAEWDDIGKAGTKRLLAPFNHGVTSRELAAGIPNLGWLTIFGKPYLDKLESLRATGLVQDFASVGGKPTAVCVQLTERPQAVVDDYAHFSVTRNRALGLIGKDLFCSPESDARWVPQFVRRVAGIGPESVRRKAAR